MLHAFPAQQHPSLQVDAHLRLEGHAPGNIFAAGDVTNLPGIKLGYQASKQARVVVANLRALIRHRGQPDPALRLPKVCVAVNMCSAAPCLPA